MDTIDLSNCSDKLLRKYRKEINRILYERTRLKTDEQKIEEKIQGAYACFVQDVKNGPVWYETLGFRDKNGVPMQYDEFKSAIISWHGETTILLYKKNTWVPYKDWFWYEYNKRLGLWMKNSIG